MQEFGKKQNEVRDAIPHGGISEIAQRSGTSIYTVSRVINGKSRNQKVLAHLNIYLSELKTVHESICSNATALLQ